MTNDMKPIKNHFHLAIYQFAEYFDEAQNVQTQTPHFNLKMTFTDSEVLSNINALYYVNLASPHLPEADFSIACWYGEKAIPHVEGYYVGLRKFNTATKMRQIKIIRGKMSKATEERLFPEGSGIPINAPMDVRDLTYLYADRNKNTFMLRAYLVAIEPAFNTEWKKLSAGKKESLIKGLDKFAADTFPGVVESVVIETPMAQNPYALLVYADTYLDVEAFMGALSSTPIAQYVDAFSDLVICNHTEVQNLEHPKLQVRRS
jgi:hypothetical protein